MRYFVTDENLIPLKEQPINGYTFLKAIERAQREMTKDFKLFGGKLSEYAKYYHIMDENCNYIKDADSAI